MIPRITIKNTFCHLGKILKHKYWVFYYCCKAGIPWRGIKHDMSKFSPTEFWESVRYYQGNRSPIDACKEDKGVSKAWMHHKGRNRHHYEYWVDNFDKGGIPVQMPYKDAVEMLCDYLGAGRAYMGKDFNLQAEYKWWLTKSAKPLAMHEHTRTFIHRILCTMAHEEKIHERSAVESVNLTPSALKWEYRDIEIKAIAREKGIYD
jgi:hypothetical protein